MVKTSNECHIESTLSITEGQREKIKNNTVEVENMTKDLHVAHIMATDENGNITSKVGRIVPAGSDPQKAAIDLQEKHRSLLRAIDKLPSTPEEPSIEEKVKQLVDECTKEERQIAIVLLDDEGNKSACCGNMHPIMAMLCLTKALEQYEKECYD